MKPVRILLEKTDFGGWEYALVEEDGSWGRSIATGWVAGSKREARAEALADAKRLGREVSK